MGSQESKSTSGLIYTRVELQYLGFPRNRLALHIQYWNLISYFKCNKLRVREWLRNMF